MHDALPMRSHSFWSRLYSSQDGKCSRYRCLFVRLVVLPVISVVSLALSFCFLFTFTLVLGLRRNNQKGLMFGLPKGCCSGGGTLREVGGWVGGCGGWVWWVGVSVRVRERGEVV